MMFAKPLYSLCRNNVPEVEMSGEIMVHDGQKTIFQTSEAFGSYPVRSLLKPFQFYATHLWEKGKLPSRYVPALGSVSATEAQINMLKKWIKESGNDELISSLKLPPTYPLDEEHRVKLKQGLVPAQNLYHMCFSKHLAVLESCRRHSWSIETYLSTQHPFHQSLVLSLEKLLGESLAGIQWVSDGCGLPSPVLRIDQTAKLFQRLFDDEYAPELNAIRLAMLSEPEWIGGPSRVDTRMMQDNPGKLICKEGADGLLALAVKPSLEFPKGLGIVIKLAAGYLPQVAEIALKPIFEKLQLKWNGMLPAGQTIQFHYRALESTHQKLIDISPLINADSAVWPGDVKFKRKVALDTLKGDHLTLSAIETTLHIGSHADAPNHFDGNRSSIDQVSLEKYQGLCQVIAIERSAPREIRVEDLKQQPILAKRVLFKTESFPDPNVFNDDFKCLSEELVNYLSLAGVILVGIDTPSVDAFESKTLQSHKLTLRSEMAILEGIDLSKAASGVYELTALPLKIEGADASPVRAVLKILPGT
ncbi:MAG: hypothetical protein EB078_02525 [Proteobacteria bacterium]|nr:hypothetical protein [Pseudomonadota bacterium]NDC23623.1 hypothetical protein [Pseudomonadota bacterium]NDD03757.1 hypothetical protein [Pseudomonadota bacterium]NDG26105.1 hypothetical protein [Pseudomonadota bacterium]